jgi:hypothetical protein
MVKERLDKVIMAAQDTMLVAAVQVALVSQFPV